MTRPLRPMTNMTATFALCFAGFVCGSSAALAQQTPALPGGASSLNETHGDWTVACVLQGEAKRCAVSQQQADPQSRQRMLAMELTLAADGKVEGALVLPFGLALGKGVTLGVDEAKPLPALAFRTCLPAGCIAPLSFSPDMLAVLRKGKQLKLEVVADGGNPVPLSVSLAGLAGALDRLVALTGK